MFFFVAAMLFAPGEPSAQSPDLDPGPVSLESFLESIVVRRVAARSLY